MRKPALDCRLAPQRYKHANHLANLALAAQLDPDISPANRTRRAAYRSVLGAAGIDPVTLTADGHPYDGAWVRRRWIEPYTPVWDALAAEVPGFPPREQAERKPTYVLCYALRRLFGLNHYPTGPKHRATFEVDQDLLASQRQRLNERERNSYAEGQ